MTARILQPRTLCRNNRYTHGTRAHLAATDSNLAWHVCACALVKPHLSKRLHLCQSAQTWAALRSTAKSLTFSGLIGNPTTKPTKLPKASLSCPKSIVILSVSGMRTVGHFARKPRPTPHDGPRQQEAFGPRKPNQGVDPRCQRCEQFDGETVWLPTFNRAVTEILGRDMNIYVCIYI